MIKNGSNVTMEYKVYVDGELVDQTRPEQPLTYTQGEGQIIPGLEKALEGLNPGDKKEVVVPPAEAYGEYMEQALLKVPRSDLPQDMEPEVGMQLQGTGHNGELYVGEITEVAPDFITVNFNHPMAGKTLRFEVEIKEVSE